jgi:hypothetical protein
MARTIAVIHQSLIDATQADLTLGGELTSESKVAIWRLKLYVVAVCHWTIENLRDIFKADVNNTIATLKPHTPKWYAQKALAFQFGYDLPADSDVYDNTGIDDATIAASKCIAYVAVIEQDKFLRIKVAALNGGDLAQVPGDKLTAFIAYMQKIKDAGVKLLITSGSPDGLKQTADIYYNPLVLNENGNRLDGTSNTPVQDAWKKYLKNLPFNGVYALQSLQDQLQLVEGVNLINIKSALSKYGALPYTGFAVFYVPDAGYLRFLDDADLALTFIPYNE